MQKEWSTYQKVIIILTHLELNNNDEALTKVLNQVDFRKNTPLMLCMILRSQDVYDIYLFRNAKTI